MVSIIACCRLIDFHEYLLENFCLNSVKTKCLYPLLENCTNATIVRVLHFNSLTY